MDNLLSLLIFFPIFGAVLLCLLPQPNDHRAVTNSRNLALWLSALHMALSCLLLFTFNPAQTGFQFEEKYQWIQMFKINYHLGVDGLSILFIPLTSLLTLCSVLVSWHSIKKHPQYFYACLLAVNGLVIGVFSALDLVLFYIFWEAMLIPMFLMIGIWGGENRIYSTVKFFLYTFFGSIFMLAAIIFIYVQTGTFSIPELNLTGLSSDVQLLLWLAFFTAFAVKVPMFPLHTWLPDAHVQAPTAGSVLLAGILLKMGAYGFLRISLPLLPEISLDLAPIMFTLSVIAIIWAALVAFAQSDIKKMIAYSSVSHMGFVTLGIFVGTEMAVQGAILQMVNHGIVSAALFMCIGVIYDRLHTRDLTKLGGLKHPMPYFAVVWVIFMLSSVALPGTNSFIGEFLILVGSFEITQWATVLATTGVVLGATYMLKLTRGVLHEESRTASISKIPDLSKREKLMFTPLIVLVLFIGLFPNLTLHYIQPWAQQLNKIYQLAAPTFVVTEEIDITTKEADHHGTN